MDAAFAVAMAGVAWLAVFGHRGVAPCAGVMALAVGSKREAWRALRGLVSPARLKSDPASLAAALTAGFAAWVAATGFWSPTPGAEWLGLTILVSAISGAALVHEAVSAAPRRVKRMAMMYAAMVSIAAGALMFEGISGGWLRDIIPPTDQSPERWKDMTALGRGVTAISPLIFPAAAILSRLTRSWTAAISPFIALLIAASSFSVFSNVAALVGGALAFLAAAARPRSCLKAIAAIAVGAIALFPFAAQLIPADAVIDGAVGPLPPSWSQRLVVWSAASDRALSDCLPLGCGADYARAWRDLGEMIMVPGSPIEVPAMPFHPHNLILQVWLELGPPGAVAFGAAAAAMFAGLSRANLDAATAAAICGALAATFFSVMFEASIWQAWRLAVFALAAFGGAMSYRLNSLGR